LGKRRDLLEFGLAHEIAFAYFSFPGIDYTLYLQRGFCRLEFDVVVHSRLAEHAMSAPPATPRNLSVHSIQPGSNVVWCEGVVQAREFEERCQDGRLQGGISERRSEHLRPDLLHRCLFVRDYGLINLDVPRFFILWSKGQRAAFPGVVDANDRCRSWFSGVEQETAGR
jgi:hypothetical protein